MQCGNTEKIIFPMRSRFTTRGFTRSGVDAHAWSRTLLYFTNVIHFFWLGLGDGWGMKPAIGRHDILKVS